MKFDPDRHHRRSIRLKDYNYAQAGAYFVTVCTHERECVFGNVIAGEVQLNEYGRIVTACWEEIPHHFMGTELDAFVVMPNHIHGVVVITNDGKQPAGARATHASPLRKPRGPQCKSVGAIIGAFKSASTKRVNEMGQVPGMPLWQRDYHEHVIRDEHELDRIREYIAANPARWAEDVNNPVRSRNARAKTVDEEFKGIFTDSRHGRDKTAM
jgi:REP element-mobilizing transposase RayT